MNTHHVMGFYFGTYEKGELKEFGIHGCAQKFIPSLSSSK